MLSRWRHSGFHVFCGNRISPDEETAMENPARYIIQAVMDAAHTGSAGDGIVALIPVEKLYRIRSKTEAKYEEA